MSAGTFTKAAGAKLDYTLDVRKRIAPSRVHHVSWSTDDPALVVGTGNNGLPAPSNTDGEITVHLGGGRPGHTHTVQALITVPDGRVFDEDFQVVVKGEASNSTARHELAGIGDPAPLATAPETETQIALRILTRTAVQTAFIAPALWAVGKGMKIKGLEGWRLVWISFSVSSAVTAGAMLIEALRKK